MREEGRGEGRGTGRRRGQQSELFPPATVANGGLPRGAGGLPVTSPAGDRLAPRPLLPRLPLSSTSLSPPGPPKVGGRTQDQTNGGVVGRERVGRSQRGRGSEPRGDRPTPGGTPSRRPRPLPIVVLRSFRTGPEVRGILILRWGWGCPRTGLPGPAPTPQHLWTVERTCDVCGRRVRSRPPDPGKFLTDPHPPTRTPKCRVWTPVSVGLTRSVFDVFEV